MSESLKAEVQRLKLKLRAQENAKCQLYLDAKKIIQKLTRLLRHPI